MADRTISPSLKITAERLGKAEVFDYLPKENLLDIAAFCRNRNFVENDVILKEGETANTLFIIERGKLALEKKIQIGRQSTPRNATIGYVEPDKIAGFSALTPPHTYSTSGICIEPTRVIAIDGDKLRDYLAANPEIGYIVMTSLASLIADRYRTSIHTLTYFLSIVSHELRSPLAAIENYLRTMLGGFTGEISPKQTRMLQRSILRVTDLRALIGDVVDLARMRPEQIQADFEWFDPGEVGNESIEDVRLAAAEKQIRIRVEPPAQFEPIVGARRRMRQVFTNLLHNAIKFSPTESTVNFRAWYAPEYVFFEVDDQGPGIPADEIPYIFTDFYRASNVGESPGAGLGLSIAYKIIEAHNGEILVSSIANEDGMSGTRFTVIIPRDLKTPEMQRREWIIADNELVEVVDN